MFTIGLWIFHGIEAFAYAYLIQQRWPHIGLTPTVAIAISLLFVVRAVLFLVNYLWAAAWSRMPWPGILGCLKIYASETCSLLWVYLFVSPFAPLHHVSSPASTDQNGEPILLVHGYLCDGSMWTWFRKQLNQRKLTNIWTISLLPSFAGIDNFSRQLETRVRHICETTNCDAVTVIAHSMGGLVTRRMIANGHGHLIRQVLTLGTPHHGTRIAMFSLGYCGRQMNAKSGWLKKLREDEARLQTTPKLTSIYSRHDQVIVPNTNSAVETATNHELTHRGHMKLAYCPDAVDLCVQAVRPGSVD